MKRKHCHAILCIIWVLVTFWFSVQVVDNSQEMSDFSVRLLDAVLPPGIVGSGITRDMTSFLVRKVAHMSEYAVLAILFGPTIWEYKKEPWLLPTPTATAAYVATDKFHQLFVPDKSGQLKDILIDTAGGTLRLGLLALILYLKRTRRTKETGKLS